jgi:hypothetical protein
MALEQLLFKDGSFVPCCELVRVFLGFSLILTQSRFILFWVLALVLLLRVGLAQFRNDGLPTTLRSLAANGMGHLNVNDMVYAGWLPDTIFGNIILANTPQLLVSLLYILYNDLFTRMHLSAQWSSYSRVHKLLRVLNPTKGAGSKNLQKRNYFLSLPLRMAIPLLIVITVLHWLVSQSIFFAMIGVNDYASPGATTANPSNGGYPVVALRSFATSHPRWSYDRWVGRRSGGIPIWKEHALSQEL